MVKTEGKKVTQRINTDDDAISEMFGYVLLIGIVISGLSVIVLLSMPTISSSQDTAQFNHIEQAFTTADSRISKARFSTSINQETLFQLNDGTISVDEGDTNSYIEIYKRDPGINPPATYTYEQIGTRIPLGTIRCELDSGEVAYQAGGVWEKYKSGTTIMVSPPDFDYNGETLTLPIMSIVGNDKVSASGGSKIQINVKSNPIGYTSIHPGGGFTNPVEQGKDIIVIIKSDYAHAWKDFVNERTMATAEIDPVDKSKVIVILQTGAPTQSGSLSKMNTKAMETTDNFNPISKFTFDLKTRNGGNCYFMSIRLHDPNNANPNPYLEIKTDRKNGGGSKEDVILIFEYIDTDKGIRETFSQTLQFDGTWKDRNIQINMLDSSIPMVFGDHDGDGYSDSGWDTTSTTWGSDPENYDAGTVPDLTDGHEVSQGQTKTLGDVTQHYLRLMAIEYSTSGPEYWVYGSDNGNNFDKEHYSTDSEYLLQYSSRQDLKYLYVTAGEIDVSLSSAL